MSDPTPEPGETFTITVACTVPETVTFVFDAVTQQDVCEATGGAVGFRRPEAAATDGTASATFTAPTTAGTYSGVVTFGDGSTQTFSITVADVASGPPVPGQGDGGAAGGDGGAAALPATGGGGSTTTTLTVAGVLLLAGIGMFGVAQRRRRVVAATV